MATTVFAVEIELQDHAAPVTEDTAIGLYNLTSDLASDAASGQADVTVDDGTVFEALDIVTVTDSGSNETAIIQSISGNVLTMTENLANSYTTAASAKVDANSRFRWIQNSVTSVTGWTVDMLTIGGINSWSRSIDLQDGGNIATPGGCQVVVRNTSQFYKSLADESIFLNGLRATIYEFSNTTKISRWIGYCEQPKWDEFKYTIPLKGPHNKRRANIGTVITAAGYPNADEDLRGDSIPVSFGKLLPIFSADGILTSGSFAKFKRVANKVTPFVLSADTIFKASADTFAKILDSRRVDEKAYPAVGDDGSTPPIMYKFQLVKDNTDIQWWSGGSQQSSGTLALDDLVDSYVHVIEGDSEDSYRKIESAQVDLDADVKIIELTLSDYFTTTLASNSAATATNNSWIQIESIARSYASDVWPCRAYLDSDGNEITQALELYSYNDEKQAEVTVTGSAETVDATVIEERFQFIRLPAYAYDDDASGSNNQIDIVSSLSNRNIDKLDSFIIEPVLTPELYDGTITDWFPGTDTMFSGARSISDYTKAEAGLWVHGITPANFTFDNNISNINNITDQLHTNGWYPTFQDDNAVSGDWSCFLAFSYILPDYPRNFTYDRLVIGINHDMLKTAGSVGTYTFQVKTNTRKFMGSSDQIYSIQYSANQDTTIENLPDFYFLSTRSTKNEKFYVTNNTGVLTSGVNNSNFEFDTVDNREKYDAQDRVMVLIAIRVTTPISLNSFRYDLQDFAAIFQKAITIKNAIYVPFSGRVFNDTWGTRKTATDLIETPGDTLEHVKRLKNWSENSATPASVGWGKGYAANALVNISLGTPSGSTGTTITIGSGEGLKFRVGQHIFISDGTNREDDYIQSISGDVLTIEGTLSNTYTSGNVWSDGSFDSVDFTDWSTQFSIANQLNSFRESYTDNVERSLCKNFFLASWIDKHGFESVKRITKEDVSPSETITLADIVDRKAVKLIEPTPSNVFPQPFVDYQKSFATDRPQESIRFLNTDADTFDSTYVEGLTGTEAEEYWNRCKTLWNYTREIGKPGKTLTGLEWANGEQSDILAQNYIEDWIDWQYNPRIIFSVHYSTAKNWEEAHQFIINLPHQTNSANVECVVTKLKFNPNPPYVVQVEAIIYKETLPVDFNIQDTMTLLGDENDWQDTTTIAGDDTDKTDTM